MLLALGEVLSGQLLSSETPVALTTGEILVSLALVAPLAFGPRAPVVVFAAVMATCVVQLAVTEHVLVADLAALVALYALLVHGPSWLKPIGLAVALVGGVAMSALASFPDVFGGFLVGTAVVTAYVLLAALLADRRVTRRARLARSSSSATSRPSSAPRRNARGSLASCKTWWRTRSRSWSPGRRRPVRGTAGSSGGRPGARPRSGDRPRRADQMRRLLGVLREGQGGSRPRRPRPPCRSCRAPGRARGRRPPRDLRPTVQLCLHRVAQEALTNVLKHADSPQRVELVLRYLDEGVELMVRDDGRATVAGDGGGHGLEGMRERVALQTGTLRAGPATGRRLRGLRPPARPGGARRVIRVFLVDDQGLVRAGLRMVVDSQPDMAVVGEAGDGRDALAQLAVTSADVVLMDVRMPLLDGVSTTRLLIERDGDAAPRVVVLTTFDLDEYVFPALRAGASGFLLKNADPEELLAAIRAVASGDAIVAPSATRRLLEHVAGSLPGAPVDDAQLADLSDREREILLEVARGCSNAEIADTLHIAEATVKTHLGRLRSKLDLHDRVQLVIFAYDSGLVAPRR
jgi:DNA-binding NarL/FixJ family response regulator